MILMPLETNRKKLLEYVERFHNIIGMYEAEKERKLLSWSYLAHAERNNVIIVPENQKHKKWVDKNIPDVIRTL